MIERLSEEQIQTKEDVIALVLKLQNGEINGRQLGDSLYEIVTKIPREPSRLEEWLNSINKSFRNNG